MSFLNVLKCPNQQLFDKQLVEIEKLFSISNMDSESLTSRIATFFENNIDYITNDKSLAFRLNTIGSKARGSPNQKLLISKLHHYVQQLLPAKNNEEIESSGSFLKEKAEDYIQSLADWINLMEIPLAPLNLPVEDLYKLIPRLTYLDLSHFDFTKYDLKKFKLNFVYGRPCFRLKTSDKDILFNVVTLCVVEGVYGTAKYIQYFGIEDKLHLFEIAKLCAERDGGATAMYINNFELENKTHLYEIAKLCAQKDIWATPQNIKNFGIEDKTHLYEIAKISAQQSGSRTAEKIKLYGIEDKTHLYEIAKLCAQHNGSETSRNINNFGIQDQIQLIEIAKLCAKQDVYYTVRNIKKFGIQDQTHLFEIAKIFAQRVCEDTLQFIIINCGIKDKTQLYEIVKLAAQENAKETSKNIKLLGIEDKLQLYEIAMLCAKQDATSTAYNINNFGIEDPDHLFEITKLCAKEAGYVIASNIKEIKIHDKTHLTEIAKLCAKRAGAATAQRIEDFGIEDKAELLEIAKMCAQESGHGTAEHIKKFKIEDQTQLFEIAKLCALRDGEGTTSYIKNFEIEDQAQLFEIAKLCAQQHGGGTAILIQNFGIKEQKQLIEIARLCALRNGGYTARYIKNFRIEDKIQLFEIAKLCAQEYGLGTARYIQKFDIEDKTQLFELAKLCAQENGGGTSENIANFGIQDKAQLFEIAKLCAQQDGGGTAAWLPNYGFDDKEKLFELAKLCASQHGGGTARSIKNFQIEDKKQLLEIAYLCAQQDGRGTAEYNKNFGIEDNMQLFEMTKLCAQQNGRGTAQYIYLLGIKDQQQLVEIAKLCAQQNGSGTAEYINNFGIQDPKIRWELFLECLNGDNTVLNTIQSFCPLPDVVGEQAILIAQLLFNLIKNGGEEKARREEFFIGIKRMIEGLSCSKENKEKWVQIADEISILAIHIQNETAPWLLKALFFCIQMTKENLNKVLETNLLLKLSELHEPRLRSLLTPGLFKINQSKSEVPKGTKGLPLIAIPFSQLEQLGVHPDKINKITRNLKQQQNKGNVLKNPVTIQSILHTIHLLATTPTLSKAQKILAIDKIFYNKDESLEENIHILLKRIAAVRVLMQMKDKEWPNTTKDPIVEFRNSFERLVPIKDFDGVVSDRYDELFAKSRNPYGLITYAAGLKTLNDPEAMECLAGYVSAVFKGKFQEARYDTSNNLHLKTISESHPEILNLWKQNSEKPLNISQDEESLKDFNPKEWVRTKLIADRHLGETKIPFIEDYFNASTDEGRAIVSKMLTVELQKETNELLKLQQACIALAEAKPDNFTPLLKEIKASLDERTEFACDVNGMLQVKKRSSDLKILITDDPIDLLLCGSDVPGSCQRLDGDPKLNKGLLGYLMDGKNRLLAIKDEKGKIVARCLLRILWDGEGPVIYRERIYVEMSGSKLKNALNQASIELAKELKVPLTSADAGNSYGKSLHALGGPAPYEYCDACNGIQKGPFTITNAKMIKEGEV